VERYYVLMFPDGMPSGGVQGSTTDSHLCHHQPRSLLDPLPDRRKVMDIIHALDTHTPVAAAPGTGTPEQPATICIDQAKALFGQLVGVPSERLPEDEADLRALLEEKAEGIIERLTQVQTDPEQVRNLFGKLRGHTAGEPPGGEIASDHEELAAFRNLLAGQMATKLLDTVPKVRI